MPGGIIMKKIVFLFCMVLVFTFLSLSAFAADTVQAEVYTDKFSINYQALDSRFEQYPILKYNDILYLPLTWVNTQTLQLNAEWNEETGLKISQMEVYGFGERETVLRDYSMAEAQIASFPIELCGKKIDNSKEQWPFLVFEGITYMPLTWDNLQLCNIYSYWNAQDGMNLYSPLAWEFKGNYLNTYALLNDMCFTPQRYHCTGYDGEKQYVVKKGETFYLHGKNFHFLRNDKKTTAKLIWVSTPPLF